jgi:hypothetical protein
VSGFPTAGGGIPLSTVTTAGDLIVATGAAAVTRLPAGALNTVLTGQGVGVAPVYAAGGSFPLSTPVAASLGAPFSVTAAFTTFLTTASLAIGTWLITLGATVLVNTNGGLGDTLDLKAALGTATATLAGQSATGASNSLSTAASNEEVSLSFLATVTVAGTLVFQARAGGTTSLVQSASPLSSTANATGYTATRVA